METTGMPKCHNPDGSIQATMADGVILLVEDDEVDEELTLTETI